MTEEANARNEASGNSAPTVKSLADKVLREVQMRRKRASTEQDVGATFVCPHDYTVLLIFSEEGCRVRCLECWTVGPAREDPEDAQRALLAEAQNKRNL